MTEYRNTIIRIDPKPAPRMVHSDKWKKRPIVLRYRKYRDDLRFLCSHSNVSVNAGVLGILFIMPMPKSWSKKKRAAMNGKPHQQTPDLDNLIKAVQDTLFKDDSHIWKYSPPPYKIWGYIGTIIFKTEIQ